jgi:hypothetical protein
MQGGAMKPIAKFVLDTLVPIVIEHLPDVASALLGAADRGELSEECEAVVRERLPEKSRAEKFLDEVGP